MATAKRAAKKAAPAVQEIVIGATVQFLGYPEDVVADDQVLTANENYVVIDIVADEKGVPMYVVEFDNADFDEAAEEDAETNPSTIETEVYAEEVAFVSGPEAEAEEVAEAAPAAPAKGKAAAKAAAPAAKAAGKAAGKPPAKTPVAAKGKATAKPVKEKVAKEEKPVVDPDALPDLENEDADVAALVNESENLVDTAKGLEEDMARNEYQLGGILYHLKKDGAYKAVDPKYAEKGGWAQFIADNFLVEYRKAQWLIQIYVEFNLAGIEDASSRVAQIGWTKASKIAGLVNEEGQDPEQLLTLAAESTVAELQESVSQSKVTVGGKKGEVKKRLTLKFSYFEDEGQGVLDLLNAAKEQHGLKDLNDALFMVVNEWANNSAGEAVAPVEAAPAQKAPVGNAKAKAAAKPVAAKGRAKA